MEKDKILIKQIENNILGIKLSEEVIKPFIFEIKPHWKVLKYKIQKQEKIISSLPPGDWEVLGLLDELTEDQKRTLIPKNYYGAFPVFGHSNQDAKTLSFNKSFETWKEHHQLYKVNPLGEKPEANKFNKSTGQIEVTESFLSKFKAWQEAENNTGNWLILILK